MIYLSDKEVALVRKVLRRMDSQDTGNHKIQNLVRAISRLINKAENRNKNTLC